MSLDGEYQIEWSAEQADKLENLAKLMRQHPGLNWSGWALGTVYVDNAAEMADVLQRLGGRWTKKDSEYSFKMVQDGDDAHFQLRIEGEHTSICTKVGEEAVETVTEIADNVREAVLAGQTTIVTTKIKPIWKCPPSILKEGGTIDFIQDNAPNAHDEFVHDRTYGTDETV